MLLLLCYYSFLVSLDRCGRSWDTLNLAYKICLENKMKDVKMRSFTVIIRTNELKALIKHM